MLTRVNIKIKVIIVIVLKANSGVNPRQGLGHGSRVSNSVNIWIKVITIIVLKPHSGDRPEARPMSHVRRVNPG
jgi:hypothetical protein